MKKTGGEGKKVKIITQQDVIELEKEADKSAIRIKINGEQTTSEERLSEFGIESSGYQVFVNTRGVNVKFDGEEAVIKVGGLYKNIQCGLCGHYSDEEEDVFRTSQNRRANNLKEFHRSYTIKNQECEESRLEKFYSEKNSEEFQIQPRKQKSAIYRESFYPDEEDSSSNGSSSEEWWSSEKDKENKREKTKPVDRTHILEYEHKICFSGTPVKRCPQGTVQDDAAESKTTKVQFFCLDRASSTARQLKRQVRQGQVISGQGRELSFFDSVPQEDKCVKAEYF